MMVVPVRRTRLVTETGHDFPAWAVGHIVVFRCEPEQAIEGRQWFAYDTRREVLAECLLREQAFRFAQEWAAPQDEKGAQEVQG